MEFVYNLLVVAHLLGMAGLISGAIVVHFAGRAGAATFALYCAIAQLVTGLALVGLGSSGVAGPEPNNAKIAVKLLIALGALVFAFLGWRRDSFRSPGVHSASGLAVINVFIAALW